MSGSRTRTAVALRNSRNASFLLLSIIASGASLAEAQTPAPPPTDRPSDSPTPIASTRSGEVVNARSPASAIAVRALARLDGTPSPGLQVTLDGSGSSGGRIWYRWLQTQGPKVDIQGATSPEARFTVPADPSPLGFVLVVGNASGVDAKGLIVEVEDPERDSAELALKADAGDDQTAKVGRKVVLNGVRSEPRGKIRYRWLQTGGPKVALKAGDGPTSTFVPTVPGTYQFALIVATTAGVMSEPVLINVTVGGTIRASASGDSMAIDELARSSLASIEGGPRHADDLSKAFDGVADAIGSFKTFAEAIAETTRRLDAVVPREKERRAVWIEQLFAPLMAKVVSGMREDGLDLAQPGAQAKPLTREQKTRLAEQFRYAAAGLRASRSLR